MHGLATVGYVHERQRGVRVLALSERSDAELAHRAYRAGAMAFEQRELEPHYVGKIMAALRRGEYFQNDHLEAHIQRSRKTEPPSGPIAGKTLACLTEAQRAIADRIRVDPRISTPCLAVRLHLSVNTVKTQLRRIYARLGVRSRAELVLLATGSPGERSPAAPQDTKWCRHRTKATGRHPLVWPPGTKA
jgi:DNA-binding NarL/FixJ family response regulator